jgi:hypothetical protein
MAAVIPAHSEAIKLPNGITYIRQVPEQVVPDAPIAYPPKATAPDGMPVPESVLTYPKTPTNTGVRNPEGVARGWRPPRPVPKTAPTGSSYPTTFGGGVQWGLAVVWTFATAYQFGSILDEHMQDPNIHRTASDIGQLAVDSSVGPFLFKPDRPEPAEGYYYNAKCGGAPTKPY